MACTLTPYDCASITKAANAGSDEKPGGVCRYTSVTECELAKERISVVGADQTHIARCVPAEATGKRATNVAMITPTMMIERRADLCILMAPQGVWLIEP